MCRACSCTPGRVITSSSSQISEHLAAGVPHTIRLRVPHHGETVLRDHVYGVVKFENKLVDDQVLMKTDGFPTYHLANVVDDHHMHVTHVLRGEEWVSSTSKHLMLYKAFDWSPPEFYHLPLLLNPNRSKLSKRQGDLFVDSLAQAGYLPQALLNFVALLGWAPKDDQQVFLTLDELVDKFDPAQINKAPAVVDMSKLEWISKQHLHALHQPQAAPSLAYATSFVKSSLMSPIATASIGDEYIQRAILASRDSVSTLGALPTLDYLWQAPNPATENFVIFSRQVLACPLFVFAHIISNRGLT